MSKRLPKHIRQAIRCGPVPKLRDWRKLPVEKLTRAERNMTFIEMECIVPEGKLVGKPLRLADFQEAFFYSVYDNPHGTSTAILSIGRKNSKTATISCLVLIHLVGPESILNAEIASGARSRDQASLVFRYARKMVDFNKELSKVVRIVPSGKRLYGLNRNTEYQALSADASTNIGGSPVVAILDEVGQVKGPRDDFIDAITTAQGAHDDPLLIAISTQAPTDADLLSVWIDDAEKNQDPHTVCHVYEHPKDADMTNKKLWKLSNPAVGLFRSEVDMKKQIDKAKRMPSFENTARNLILNQRVSVTFPFVSKLVWNSCAADPAEMGGAEVWAGLDLSAHTDLTSCVFIWVVDGVWQVKPYFWTPEDGIYDRAKRDRVPYDVWARQGLLETTPGKTVGYEYVVHRIGELVAGCHVNGVGFDRWRIDVFKKELERAGLDLPLLPYGQGYKDQSPALDALEAALLNGKIAHGGHPVLTMCAANAVVVRDPAGNRKLDKAKATGRIDGMAALANAFGVAASQVEEGPSVYETRGVLTFGGM